MRFLPLSMQGVEVVGRAFATSLMPTHPAEDGDDWTRQALCAQADPERWYPEKGGSTREARRVCNGCPVAAPCLEYALAHEEMFGIWGGLTEGERKAIRHARAAGKAA